MMMTSAVARQYWIPPGYVASPDLSRGELLLERLGPSLRDLALPIESRHKILVSVSARVWRPARGTDLPTGAEKGQWLIDFIATTWEELDHPCSEHAVDYALAC